MSTEKLRELGKPVAYTDAEELRFHHATSDMWPVPLGFGKDVSLYSQEYVSSLLAELEAKDKRIAELSRLLAHNIERAEKAEKRLVYSKDAIATWERKAISNFDECATMSQRIIELEAIRSDASQVLKEIGNELGCNPDNESIMTAIDDLKATQVTGPLALIIKRTGEMERILEGVTPEMIAGGWTAKGISDYAKSLEAKLATPVRLSCETHPRCRTQHAKDVRAAGFRVEGDE